MPTFDELKASGEDHLFRTKNYVRAKEILEKAYRLNQRDPDLLYDLAFCCLTDRQYELANRYLEQALEVQPDHQECLSLLGKTQFRLRSFAAGIQTFKSLTSPSPEDLAYMALSLNGNKQFEEAERILSDLNSNGLCPVQCKAGLAFVEQKRDNTVAMNRWLDELQKPDDQVYALELMLLQKGIEPTEFWEAQRKQEPSNGKTRGDQENPQQRV